MTDQPRCTAHLTAPYGPVTYRCDQPAGHYDPDNRPISTEDGEMAPHGWHRAPNEDGFACWSDEADGATPHRDPDPVEPTEPDNPAATALARHIADHPISVVQAAFRELGMRLTFELHEEPRP